MDGLSRAVLGAGPVGLFFYGVLNRILIVTAAPRHQQPGLVHLGDFHGADRRPQPLLQGDPTAGAFMTGFFR